MACFLNHVNETTIKIPRNVDNNGITFYDIQIIIGPVSWTVQHRYKEFVDLHEKLVSGQSIDKDLLPPKKVIGNRSPTFLENRQKNLEKYLQKVLIFLQLTMCREFVEFLHFNRYDIIYLLQDLAEHFYLHGDTFSNIVANNADGTRKLYEFSVLELYSITERLKLPCPTLTNGIRNVYDFSHVAEFCSQLDTIIIWPQQKHSTSIDCNTMRIGTSNIMPSHLKFDLNAFRSIKRLTLNGISIENLCDADWLRENLVQLSIHHTNVHEIKEILLCDCIHRDTVDLSKLWKNIEIANFANNLIDCIDTSIQLLPKLSKLNLSNNFIKMLSNLHALPYLSELNLCNNRLSECIDCHLELGNLITLNLSQNQLKSLNGFRKMYSLVRLDVSCNVIELVDEVDAISKLPCLEELLLTGNPVSTTVDYRQRVLSRFDERCQEIVLDNEKGNSMEIDMALVLAALRKSEKSSQLKGKNIFSTSR